MIASALALYAGAPVAAAAAQQEAGSTATAREYAVYSAVLESVYASGFEDAFLVAQSTHGPIPTPRGEFIRRLLAPMSGVSTELLNEYSDKNTDASRLSAACFRTTIPVVLVKWGLPTEWIEFSHVAFTDDGTWALVHV